MRESPIYQEILQEGEERGKAQGRAEGKAEGKAETLQQVAINLLSTNMALEDISRVTGLTVEQLRVLQREQSEQ